MGDVMVFQAGTIQQNNDIVTDGGRVLAVTALAETLKQAVDLSIQNVENIYFEGMNFRRDIGFEFI
jgi:phosphoribosylamine--glycine ligase